jgi:pSer/pThr/pTyr-binding forkhead associated (FHA) protein
MQPTLADLMGVLAVACANLPRERFADTGQMEAALKVLATGIAVKVRDNQNIEITISHQDRTEVRSFSGECFLIGRLNEQRASDIDLSPDPSVSHVHARLWRQDGQWWFEDLDGSYGSRINGDRLTALGPVGAQDMLELGETQLKISL